MRFGAFRRVMILAVLFAFLAGCSSATKKAYLRHLSVTIAPVEIGVADVNSARPAPAVIAAADTGATSE